MKSYVKVLASSFLIIGLLSACVTKEGEPKKGVKQTEGSKKNEPTKKLVHADYKKYDAQISALKNSIDKYKDVTLAVKDGYVPSSGYVPMMGYHFQNPAITTFELTKPTILLYSYENGKYKLLGAEWGTADPKNTPSPVDGEEWQMVHEASAHYDDGSELPAKTPEESPKAHPVSGAKMTTWHPDIYGIHVYTHVLNPEGPFKTLNPNIPSDGIPTLPPGYEKYITEASGK